MADFCSVVVFLSTQSVRYFMVKPMVERNLRLRNNSTGGVSLATTSRLSLATTLLLGSVTVGMWAAPAQAQVVYPQTGIVYPSVQPGYGSSTTYIYPGAYGYPNSSSVTIRSGDFSFSVNNPTPYYPAGTVLVGPGTYHRPHRGIQNSVLVNPTVINSPIYNSTLVNPTIITTPRYPTPIYPTVVSPTPGYGAPARPGVIYFPSTVITSPY